MLLSLNLDGLLAYPCFALSQCGLATGQARLHAGWSPLHRIQQWGISFFSAGQLSCTACAAPPHLPQVGAALHTLAICPNLKQEKHCVGRRPSSNGSQSYSSASNSNPLSQRRLASRIEVARRTIFALGLGPGRPLVLRIDVILTPLVRSMSAIRLFVSFGTAASRTPFATTANVGGARAAFSPKAVLTQLSLHLAFAFSDVRNVRTVSPLGRRLAATTLSSPRALFAAATASLGVLLWMSGGRRVFGS